MGVVVRLQCLCTIKALQQITGVRQGGRDRRTVWEQAVFGKGSKGAWWAPNVPRLTMRTRERRD